MKTTLRIIAGAAVILVAVACEKTLDEPIIEMEQETRVVTKAGTTTG